MVLPLVVMEKDSLKLVDEAMARDRIIGLAVSKKQENVRPMKKATSPRWDAAH
jgi:ATP-dependent Lon protease